LIPLIETLLQDENIQRAIIEAIDEQPDAGSIELQPIAENDLTVVGPDTPEVESSLPFSFGSSGAGKVGFQSLDGQPVVSNGQPVTLNGQPLTYSWDAGTNTLTAMAGQTPIFSLTVDPVTGNFTLTLLSQVDHPLQGADVLQLELDFTVVAANGQQATGSLIVNVADDVPVAMNDQAVVTPEAPSTNVVLMIDRSMSEADFNLAKSAAMALVMAAGVSQVLIVDFAGNVHDSGWMSASAAESYIDGLDRTGGGTDLDGALLRVIQEYFGADSADATYMYALSNGGASTGLFGIGGDQVGPLEEIAWKLFLAGVGVDGVFGYTLGGNGSSQLAPVGWNPDDPFSQQIVQQLDGNQELVDHFNSIVNTSLFANGNVLCNDDTGADVLGSGLVSVEIGGVTFSFDGSNVGVPQQHPFQLLDTDGARLSLQTDQGGFFTFYFADQGEHSAGDWSYMAPAGSGSLPYENIRYTMNDGDGDTSTASLTIITDSNAVNGAVVAGDAGDNVIEGDGLNTDVLVGNLGSDTFVLNSGDIADYIADYRFGEDDRIDLNHLLSGLGVDESNISDFIHIVDNGDGAGDALMVDVTGQGNFQQATTVAYLDSSAGVNIVVDDMTAQVNASNNNINV
ncbi:MAG: type I secretion C-terminal target domain-containing protein, partial [Hyphomicrobiales bacterium]